MAKNKKKLASRTRPVNMKFHDDICISTDEKNNQALDEIIEAEEDERITLEIMDRLLTPEQKEIELQKRANLRVTILNTQRNVAILKAKEAERKMKNFHGD